MKTIRSRDNPVYKRLARLALTSQARKREGLSVLDGVHGVQAYLERVGAPSILAVSESGITSSKDVRWLRHHNVRIVLVGEHLMRADDPGAALAQLLGLPIR